MTVRFSLRRGSRHAARPPYASAAGFRVGVRGRLPDFRSSLTDATRYIDAAVTAAGHLILGDADSSNPTSTISSTAAPFRLASGKPVALTLTAARTARMVTFTLAGKQGGASASVTRTVSADAIQGSVCVLATGRHGPTTGGDERDFRFVFSAFTLSAPPVLVTHHRNARNFGPILWSQYVISGTTLRLQAQLAPIDNPLDVELWTRRTGASPSSFALVATVTSDKLSRTALFTLPSWNARRSAVYEVRVTWRRRVHVWTGVIRRTPPSNDRPLRIAAFSCDKAYMFPQAALTRQVARHNPDLLFFAGDQIYEDTGRYGAHPTDFRDFLRKVAQFGWTWRQLLKNRPAVILPDDHDVFQPNIWGAGGRRLPPADVAARNFAAGGYEKSPKWVAAAEKVYTGHLPPSPHNYSASPMPNGMRAYYTGVQYAGLRIAALEDRKWKTGPLSLALLDRARGAGASLLGAEQEAFLERWYAGGKAGDVNIALSQTPFTRAFTHSGPQLRRATGSVQDSNAWPVAARHRAVRTLARHSVVSMHGDQHLGIAFRQGVPGNALGQLSNVVVAVPGTANGFPRAWWPAGIGKQTTGNWKDDLGNPMQVLAAASIDKPLTDEVRVTRNDVTKEAYARASGYAIVHVDRTARSVNISMYRVGGKRDEQFPGFPVVVDIDAR